MGRKRQLVFGAINITMPAPHLPDRYIKLFQRALAEKRTVKLRGDWVGLLGSASIEEDAAGGNIVRGEIYKYIDLVATRKWFNVEKRKPADAADMDGIVIPDELKPHFQFLPFVFFPKRHRLVLITKDGSDCLSPRQAADILFKVFNSTRLVAEFGTIDIVVEPSRETLDAIFGMTRLRSLEIEITPPNPDDFEEFERQLFDGMAAQRAGSYKISLHEAGDRGLVPDERIRLLAEVGQSNGKVVGVGGGRGRTIRLSTADHPISDKIQYDASIESRRDVLLAKARELLRRLRRRAD